MKLLITGATGFLGGALTNTLIEKYSIVGLTRNIAKAKHNQPKVHWIESLSKQHVPPDITAIINLAGAPINKRWHTQYKNILLRSRVDTTQALVDLIQQQHIKPHVMLSGSAIGYYGHDTTIHFNEHSSPSNSNNFPHQLCHQWEQTALQAESLTRVCLLRTGVILGKGGLLQQLYWPFYLGLGSIPGDGHAWLSWMHLDDWVSAVQWLLHTNTAQGAYNLTASEPVQHKKLYHALANTLRRPCLLKLPKTAVKLLFGEMGEQLMLKGQYVEPMRLIDGDFIHQYTHIDHAISAIYGKK